MGLAHGAAVDIDALSIDFTATGLHFHGISAYACMMEPACTLCNEPGGQPVWSDSACRVVLVEGDDGAAFPGFCRVVWNAHVAEMSDLDPADANHLLQVVLGVERATRQLLAPDKINLASLGNFVPHLHWHVIPRWCDDSRWPGSIWASPVRPDPQRFPPSVTDLRSAVGAALSALPLIRPQSLS